MGGSSELRRVARHVSWVRSQGLFRLVEEDELNPITKLKLAARRAVWRRANPVPPGTAVPVFLLGLQRSGTNMVARGFRSNPEFEVFNENDKRAFTGFRLRALDQVAELARKSRHRWVLFKPLCDSHRAVELLGAIPGPTSSRALWVHRQVDPRIRSALAKFGDANLQALRAIGSGEGEGLWQAGGLSDENLALIRSFDLAGMSPASGAALFWYVRNCLFFELELDCRADVLPVSYDRLIENPEIVSRQICGFLGCPWNHRFWAHIERREPAAQVPVDIDPRIRALCERLQTRFDALDRPAARSATEGAPPG